MHRYSAVALALFTALAGCPKEVSPDAAADGPEPLRFAVSQVPFQDLCISPVNGGGSLSSKDQDHLDRALVFLQEGKIGYTLTAIAQIEAPNPRSDALRAVAMTLSGRAGEAEAVHAKLVTDFPEDGCLHMAAALNAAALGKMEEAVPLAFKAWEADKTDIDAALLWASLRGSWAPESAVAGMEQVHTAFPDDASAAWLYALALMDVGRTDEAQNALDVARKGGLPVDEVLVEVFYGSGDIGAYLGAIATTDVPLMNREAIAGAGDPMAVYRESLGLGDGQTLFAVLETSRGDLRCELYADKTPVTVSNFVGLATGKLPWTDPRTGEPGEGPLYTDIVFHRVIPEFMVQVGDPLGNGTGGPGYRFRDEVTQELIFDRPGRLAMANSGPATNGSQFFVTEIPTQHLSGKHTIFGQCDNTAIELVKEIARVPAAKGNRPDEDVIMKSIRFEAVDPPLIPVPVEDPPEEPDTLPDPGAPLDGQ